MPVNVQRLDCLVSRSVDPLHVRTGPCLCRRPHVSVERNPRTSSSDSCSQGPTNACIESTSYARALHATHTSRTGPTPSSTTVRAPLSSSARIPPPAHLSPHARIPPSAHLSPHARIPATRASRSAEVLEARGAVDALAMQVEGRATLSPEFFAALVASEALSVIHVFSPRDPLRPLHRKKARNGGQLAWA